jgi:hypothetical protein
MKVQENLEEHEVNSTHPLMVYANCVKNRNFVRIGTEIKTQKNKYMFMLHYQDAQQNHNPRIAIVAKFPYIITN